MLQVVGQSAVDRVGQSATYINDGVCSRFKYSLSMIPFVLVFTLDGLIEGTVVLAPALLEIATTYIFGCTQSTALSTHLYNALSALIICVILLVSFPFYTIFAVPLANSDPQVDNA